MKVIEEIRSFFVKKKFIKNKNEIKDDDSLLEMGVIDSVGMLELVNFIESKYSIKVDEDELMPENFESLKAIQDFLTEKIG